jgi:tetratricopeptide (TPR) repeat protein
VVHFSQDNPDRRLDSWKEIASFFGRDERTVRRWEKEHALPVHRIPSGVKGRVFAYDGELRQWLSSSKEFEPTIPSQESRQQGPANHLKVLRQRVALPSAVMWLSVLAICAALTAAIVPYRSAHRFAVHASVTPMTATLTQPSGHSSTSEAENLYLEGRYYWNKRTPDDLNRAVDYFTQAIVRDPSYSKAYVGLADSYNLLREYSAMPASEAYPRALAAATKAVRLDDNSAEAHTSLAFVTFFWSWDAASAEREFKRALVLNPNDARAHHWYASFLLACRRFPESVAEIETAQRLDPSSVTILADKAEILHVSNQTDAAVILLKQIETAEPSFASAHRYLSEIYFTRKNYLDYLSELKKTAVLLQDQQELEVTSAAEKGFLKGGYKGMLESTLGVQRRLNREGSMSGYNLAVTCARMGQKKDALKYLRSAYEEHESLLLSLPTEPSFDLLHDDPEYRDLVARVNPSAQLGSLPPNLVTHNY